MLELKKKEKTVKGKVKKVLHKVAVAEQNPVWAVISLGGAQRRVREGDVFTVNRLAEEPRQKVTVDDVYLFSDGAALRVGQPKLAGVTVELEVMENLRGEKIDVFKYKAKARYRKRKGHRQELSRVKVLKFVSGRS